MCRLMVGMAMVVGIACLLAACGDSTKQTQGVVVASTSSNTVTALRASPPSKQEIVKARGCLESERVRPAKHTPYRPQVPRGPNEMTRNGLPMTPEEYEATVRRCVATPKVASVSTHRK